MSIDPSFGRPFERFAPVSSFVQPVAAPTAGPLDGPLVALPCINQDWLKLLLGAAAQLENPSAWKSGLSDSTTLLAVQRAQELRAALAEAGECVNPVVQIALDCTNGLQYQTADGIWHVGTSMADICTCVVGCTVPAVPPNPGGSTTAQQACNLAGYLAQRIIEVVIQKLVTFAQSELQQAAFANSVLQELGFAFPITAAAGNAAYDLFQAYISGVQSQYEFASTDVTLWSEVTCAIYEAIQATGYVTSANLPNVVANICGINYTYPQVISAICSFCGALGIQNWQAMQIVGSLDDVDCSGCASWCQLGDFSSAPLWNPVSTPLCSPGAAYVAGSGWETVYCASHNVMECDIFGDLAVGHTHNQIDLIVQDNNATTGTGDAVRKLFIVDAGFSILWSASLPNQAYPSLTKITTFVPNVAGNHIILWWRDNGNVAPATIKAIQLHGQPGADPYSPVTPCIY